MFIVLKKIFLDSVHFICTLVAFVCTYSSLSLSLSLCKEVGCLCRRIEMLNIDCFEYIDFGNMPVQLNKTRSDMN